MPALIDYPLSGVHLIEASAGTGKTYTISALFVRLLLEKELAVRHILVVTYTKAATEDLRLRVRQMVSSCLQAFVTGEGRDDFQQSLLTKVQDHDQAAMRLLSALQDFDEAAIFTIHAFCQRMLKENSLESGALFDTELVPDVDDILHEIAADFWRLQMDRFPVSFTSFVRKKVLPDNLFLFYKKVRPGLLFFPEVDSSVLAEIAAGGVIEEAEQDIARSLDELYRVWPEARDEVSSLLLASTDLSRNSYRPDRIPVWLDEMAAFCRVQPAYHGELYENFAKFSAGGLVKATKKNGSTPRHPFFDLCQQVCVLHDQLTELFNQGLIALRQEAGRYGLAEFERRKMEKNLFAYDDLLRKLQQALQGRSREMLIRQILGRFPAALIDEFQDTDPVQYEIFSTLYKCAAENLLFIIGDPKQAIYSFRGADIFTYLEAIRDVPSSFELAENYRSEPSLIKAVNALFSSADNPFVYRRIAFQPVSPAAGKQNTYFTILHKQEPPLQLWQMMRGAGEHDAMPKEVAGKRILASLAVEIRRLLDLGGRGEALIGDRSLGPRDIAVLVRENREARQVQQALYQVGVPAVQQSTEDLFVSREAGEVLRVLAAVAEPGNEKSIRSALATDMLGGTCAVLAALEQDEKAWSNWFASFLSYQRCWQEKGFMAMFRLLLDSHHVRVQQLRFVDGERRLTNVLHLGEVLHGYERQYKASPAALLAWLAEKMADGQNVEEHQLRLESDAERVQIVTIHRSKGLQYPIVFCPFCWGGARAIRDIVSFHLPTGDHRPAMDLGSDDMEMHKELARQEELAENMRLLYVALTRAVHRCYLVWGSFNGAESSALAWLLHGRDDFAALKKRFKKLSDQELADELAGIISLADGSIELVRRADDLHAARQRAAETPTGLICRTFTGEIGAMQVTSFSAITSHGRLGESFVFREEAAGQGHDDSSIFAFPRGAAPGTFMHDVFEHLDFPLLDTEPDTVRQVIARKLAQHGFEVRWQDAVMTMVANVLATPLLPDRQDLVLQNITREQRLNELEFCFPLAAVSAGRVKEILRGQGFTDAAASSLEFSAGNGFLKGFIDLVFSHDNRFYLVDWKSNHLGFTPPDYRRDRLQEVMLQERYTLQYLLYTVALHHYLAGRIADYRYEDHFGGLFYIFLRGVSREHGPAYGIYHDRPDARLVEQLGQMLVAG
ncbi:MAG: exodeoxyribonuclease V subunit beta [Proteobacteria bacterium]|nr:exodeoxyribonuclease V subunit beta [Pseudomonadota bacterium]MBU4295257.1 exodeoxyribonuclease V subunit beta [Pseudomonadota bacterium]MCG2750193.1 exodeoxyribonuclease V subunit beta [Desulfobulbaceae bacterium]